MNWRCWRGSKCAGGFSSPAGVKAVDVESVDVHQGSIDCFAPFQLDDELLEIGFPEFIDQERNDTKGFLIEGADVVGSAGHGVHGLQRVCSGF